MRLSREVPGVSGVGPTGCGVPARGSILPPAYATAFARLVFPRAYWRSTLYLGSFRALMWGVGISPPHPRETSELTRWKCRDKCRRVPRFPRCGSVCSYVEILL